MPEFIPGRELSRAFYAEVVRPLIGEVEHSAALLGWGSDVLGFDTVRSTDHGWGPRLRVFVDASDVPRARAAIDVGVPDEFRGWPTRYGWDDVPVSSHVNVRPLSEWLERQLGYDARAGLTTLQWLTTPQQLLSEVVGGEVFWDGTGELEPLRKALEWYPDDVWRWLVGCQWWRIDQEEPFVRRTAEVGDELGSRIVAARLARDAVRLGFLLDAAMRRTRSGSARPSHDSSAQQRSERRWSACSPRTTAPRATRPGSRRSRRSRAGTTRWA